MFDDLIKILKYTSVPTGTAVMEKFLLGKDEISTDLPGTVFFDSDRFEKSTEEFFTYENVVMPKRGSFFVLRDDEQIIMVVKDNSEQRAEQRAELLGQQVKASILFNSPSDVTVNGTSADATTSPSALDFIGEGEESLEENPESIDEHNEPPIPADLGEQEPFMARVEAAAPSYPDEIEDF